MNDGDKKEPMEQKILEGYPVTWGGFWEKYKENKQNLKKTFIDCKIHVPQEQVELYETILAAGDKAHAQVVIKQMVENLIKKDVVYGETTAETRAATKPKISVNVEGVDDDIDLSYDSENVTPKRESPLSKVRGPAAAAKESVVKAGKKTDKIFSRKKPFVDIPSQKNTLELLAKDFESTEGNRREADETFGMEASELANYENSAYVQSEAAKLKHDPTIRGGNVRNPTEEVLDGLRDDFMDNWYGAQSALRDESPEKHQEKNYGRIMGYANALNNILKACAEKTGGPEWTPDAKLIAPLQWMLAQRPNDAELKVLYRDVMVNMMLARSVPGIDKKQLVDLSNAFKNAVASNNYMAAYEFANNMIEVTLKNTSDPTALAYRAYLMEERAGLEKYKPQPLNPEDIMAEVERQLAEEEKAEAAAEAKASEPKVTMRTPVIAGDTSVRWELYWSTYDEVLKTMPPDDKNDRKRSFEAHRRTGLVLSIDIKNLKDNHRTVFVNNQQTPENYKQSFMDMVVGKNLARSEKVAEAERAAKNEARLSNLNAELMDMNTKNFSTFIADDTRAGVSALVQQHAGTNRMIKEFGNRYLAVVDIFKKIAALTEADPIKRADQIADLLLANKGKNYKAIIAYNTFFALVEKVFDATPNPKYKQKITERNQALQVLKNAVALPFQWLLKYSLHLPQIKSLLPTHSDLTPVVDSAMGKFVNIGEKANRYKSQLETSVQQIQQLSDLEQSRSTSEEMRQHISDTAESISRELTELELDEEQVASDLDTESPGSSPRSITPVTTEDHEESLDDLDVEDTEDEPVVFQAPGDEFGIDPEAYRSRKEFERMTGDRGNISLEGMSKQEPAKEPEQKGFTDDQIKILAAQYQHVRDAFAQGRYTDAVVLLKNISTTVSEILGKNTGADDYVPALIEAIKGANQSGTLSQFDIKMADTLLNIFEVSGGFGNYYTAVLKDLVDAIRQESGITMTEANVVSKKPNLEAVLSKSYADEMLTTYDLFRMLEREYHVLAQNDMATPQKVKALQHRYLEGIKKCMSEGKVDTAIKVMIVNSRLLNHEPNFHLIKINRVTGARKRAMAMFANDLYMTMQQMFSVANSNQFSSRNPFKAPGFIGAIATRILNPKGKLKGFDLRQIAGYLMDHPEHAPEVLGAYAKEFRANPVQLNRMVEFGGFELVAKIQESLLSELINPAILNTRVFDTRQIVDYMLKYTDDAVKLNLVEHHKAQLEANPEQLNRLVKDGRVELVDKIITTLLVRLADSVILKNRLDDEAKEFEQLSGKEKGKLERSPEFQLRITLRTELMIAVVHKDPSQLAVYLKDELFMRVLEKNPELILKLQEGLDEASLDQIGEVELLEKAILHYENKYRHEVNDETKLQNLRKAEAALQLLAENDTYNKKAMAKAINKRILSTPDALRTDEERREMKPLRDPEKKAERNAKVDEAWEAEFGKLEEHAEGLSSENKKQQFTKAVEGVDDRVPLLEKIGNAVLKEKIIEKFRRAIDNGITLPSKELVEDFVKEVNKALQSKEGLSYERYDKLMEESDSQEKGTNYKFALFNVKSKDVFPDAGKGALKQPMPPAPAAQAQNTDVKPHPSK